MQQEESEHEHHHQSLILLKTCAKELLKYTTTRYLKITEKVAFDIASEASYAYIGPKFTKNAKKWSILAIFGNLKFGVNQRFQTGQF